MPVTGKKHGRSCVADRPNEDAAPSFVSCKCLPPGRDLQRSCGGGGAQAPWRDPRCMRGEKSQKTKPGQEAALGHLLGWFFAQESKQPFPAHTHPFPLAPLKGSSRVPDLPRPTPVKPGYPTRSVQSLALPGFQALAPSRMYQGIPEGRVSAAQNSLSRWQKGQNGHKACVWVKGSHPSPAIPENQGLFFVICGASKEGSEANCAKQLLPWLCGMEACSRTTQRKPWSPLLPSPPMPQLEGRRHPVYRKTTWAQGGGDSARGHPLRAIPWSQRGPSLFTPRHGL